MLKKQCVFNQKIPSQVFQENRDKGELFAKTEDKQSRFTTRQILSLDKHVAGRKGPACFNSHKNVGIHVPMVFVLLSLEPGVG